MNTGKTAGLFLKWADESKHKVEILQFVWNTKYKKKGQFWMQYRIIDHKSKLWNWKLKAPRKIIEISTKSNIFLGGRFWEKSFSVVFLKLGEKKVGNLLWFEIERTKVWIRKASEMRVRIFACLFLRTLEEISEPRGKNSSMGLVCNFSWTENMYRYVTGICLVFEILKSGRLRQEKLEKSVPTRIKSRFQHLYKINLNASYVP